MNASWLQRSAFGIVIITMLLQGAALSAPPATRADALPQRERPLVIAHQGGEHERPSNTMASFTHAAALGVDVLEMDIHSSADGVLVTIHDDTVDRTTNGSGKVNALTLTELKALDAGWYWTADDGATYPYRGQGITIAALEEVLAAFPTMPMNIEIKQVEPSIAAPFCGLLREYGATDRVLVASFRAAAMADFRAVCPEVTTSLVEDEVRVFFYHYLALGAPLYRVPGNATAVQVPEFGGGFHILTPSFVRAAHGRGLDVHAWTINDAATMEQMIAIGVDGIITDRPTLLQQTLAQP